jgi:hypothetical protein
MSISRRVIRSSRIAVFVLLALSTASRAAAQICLDVTVRFTESKPPHDLVQSMKDETSSIWNTYGVGFQWANGTTVSCASVHGSLNVVVDHQRRRSEIPVGAMLGRTMVPLAAIEHAPIYIDRGAIERLLASLNVEEVGHLVGHPVAGLEDVGRALGRVLAHEIGHVILGAREHQQRGLMRPTFRPRDLIGPWRELYTLSDAEVTRLRQRAVDLRASSSAHEKSPEWLSR